MPALALGISKEFRIRSASLAASLQWVFRAALGHKVDIATGGKLADARQVLPEELAGTLVRLIREVRFGSIEIIVHDGRITQIERREKLRFSPSGPTRRE